MRGLGGKWAVHDFRLEAGLATGSVEVPDDSPLMDGHFPGHPLLPGVAQAGLVRWICEMAMGGPVRVSSIRHMKFLRQVPPGTVLRFEVDVGQEPAQEPGQERGRAAWEFFDDDGRVSKGELTFASGKLRVR
ncbi:MAG: hypothetical protein GXP54_10535 [Deltaproteobacteria bacterium]|nr:hypothetical protein [Deltaproteobacteria bacterium]